MTDNLLDGFDEIADGIEQERQQQLRAAAVSTGAPKPDDAARANTIAERRGLPFGVVADNLQDFHEQDRLESLDAVGQRAPVVGQFLADPRRMALAGDEAEGLEKLSGSLDGSREPEDMGFFHRTVRNLLPISDSTYNGTVGATLDYMGARFQAADAKVFSTAAQSLGRVLTFANTANRLTSDIYQREAEAAAARGDTARSEALAQAAGRYRDPAGVEGFTQSAQAFTRDLTAQQQALGAQVQRPASVGAAIDAPGNSLRYYGGMLADSVPAMIFAMATRNPEAGAAVMGGTTGVQTYADRVNEGATDLQALKEGAAQGGLEAVGSVIPLSHAFGGGARRFLTTPLSEALSEGATQAAQVDAEDLLQGKQTPTSEKLAQVLDAMIVGGPMGLIEAAGGGGPSHAQQRVFGEQMQQAVASTDQAAQLQEITTAAKDSRLVDRSPADAEAFVEAAGAADATVYLPADAVATLFQSAPGALEQAVGGPEALAEQMALGDISIPMAKWVSIVSRLPNVDEIRRHARLSADGLSEVELENFSPEGMAQELGIGNESTDAAGAAPEAAAQVQADVYAQLLATQRYTPAQAEAQAKLWGAAFGRIGQMTGQDPLALYKQRMAGIDTGADTAAAPAKTFMQRSIDALRGLLGRPRVAQDARGQQTIERDGSVYAQRAGKWLLTDEQGQPRDFLTLNQAQAAAEAAGGEVVQDDPIEGQRQTWSVALPDTAAREVLSGDIVSLYQGPADPNAPDLDFGDRTDEQLSSEYAALPSTDGGRIIDTDMVRELSPEYRADRSLSPRIHRAASTLTRGLFAQALAGPVAEGRDPVVVFTAGGGGSGKSTAIKAVLGDRNADITLDGTLSNLERARSDVAAALASGRNVEIRYVYRSPRNSVEGAIGRAIRTGRPVPVSVLAEAHANAPKVVRALAQEYTEDGRVSITAINNDGPMGTAFEIPIEEIPDVNQRSAERTFRAALDDARSAGRVSPELYAAFGGSPEAAAPAGAAADGSLDGDAAGAGRVEPASAGLRGRPQPGRTQRRRNAVAADQNPAGGGVSDSGDNRGRIDVFPDQRMAISLFENADLSTFLHESGHFFLEVYRDAAAAESATPQFRADFDALLGWLGVDSPDKIGVDQHEQFARGFEAYLAEGRAPSPELQSVFSQFRAWLLGVYRTLTRLNVQLTDEVRGVFDRMLATETEIEVAQAKVGLQPLARDASEAKQLGLTEKQFADYQRLLAASAEEARAEVQQKLEDAHHREREVWWKDESAKVRAEVEAETEALPAVRARRILTGRAEAAGEPVPAHLQGLKLDRAALVADYGARHLKKLGRVFVREGGVHPDEAAALLGFSSGDDLVQNLWVVDQTLAAVPDEVRRRMHERHGNPMTDGTLPELALEAVHNSKRVQVLDRELAVLAQLAGEPRPNRRELRAVAEDVVARKTDRQIKPNGYLAAERRAAADSARAAAAKDYAAALLAKRRQALNAALYAAARRAKDEIASKASDIRKQSEGKARERLGKAGADYLEAMDALTEAFEFRPVSGREVVRRQSLRAWVEARQADDDLTAITDALLSRVEAERVTNYQDMTLAELRELHEAVTNIAHLARLKNELLKGKDKREWEEAQAELANSIRSALDAGKPLPFSDQDRTLLQSVGGAYEGLLDWVLRPETVVEWLDGGEAGPWHDYLWNQAEAAQQLRIEYRNKVGGMLVEMSNAMTKEQRADLQRKVFIRGLGRSMSRNTIIAAALNMGNAGNRDKLMRGGYLVDGQTHRFTHGDIAEMLGHLTPADGQMIQRIWDAVDSLWPDIEAQQKRLSGVAPERIEPTPLIFSGADGAQISLRGGYYPAVYDPRASRGGTQQARAAEERVMGGTFSRAMTSKGHTKERTEYVAPMLLDYHAVLSRHLNDVITDLSHRGYVKQALRVLEDGELKGLIMERVSEGAYHALYGSVKNSVAGASVAEPGSKMVEKIGDAVLTNTSVAALGFRIPLVLANSVVAPIQAAARVDTKYLASGYIAYYRNPAAATRTIHALSPFMAERADSLDSTYQQVLGKLTGKKGIRAAAMKMAMEVHRWVVPLAERAIWLGRYQQAQAEGAGVAGAVLLANKAIRMTQQAGAPKDLSAAERDPRYKWVRMFIGPMVIMNNRLQESGLRGLYLGRVQSPARALGTWLSAAVLSNAVFEILMGRGPDDDDDDGKGAEDWAPWLARKSLLFPFQTFPLLRDVASGIDAMIEGKPSSSRPNPLVDAGVALTKFGQAAWNETHDWFAEDDEVDAEKLVKTGVRAAGPLTGIPSNQMLTTGEYLYDVGTGQYTPDNPAEAAAYLMYRRPRDKQ